MTDYIRRLVSGNKARFKDGKLNLELDLVYVTDQVIIMGYPASGIEGFYRNRREDAQKFLNHRHGKNFWVYNFCPVKENSYPSSVFDGRVSRYPFPDHHAPPLALLPLAAREMHAWLQGSPERVIVLHCKAGKGRSGTLACTYLLSLEDSPAPPKLERSYSVKQWAKVRADELMQSMPNDDTEEDLGDKKKAVLEAEADSNAGPVKTHSKDEAGLLKPPGTIEQPSPVTPKPTPPPPLASSEPGAAPALGSSFSGPLKNVLDLHTSRRMKAPSPDTKVKQGVSIPSQRRWLYYWSQILTHQGPSDFWPLSPPPAPLKPKVRLTQIKVRMREMSGVKMNLVKAANLVIDRTNMTRGGGNGKTDEKGHLWVSLARYDDDFVDTLERWERHTRDESGHMGRRKRGSEHAEDEELSEVFSEGKWDKSKMVRSFARLGALGDSSIKKDTTDKDGKITSYTLRPLTDAKWATIREEVEEAAPKLSTEEIVASETNSIADATQTLDSERGIILDANREVRVKLYMGQVFMGWLWFIPTFHMSHPLTSSQGPTRFLLTRKEVDFPLGVGAALIDVEISLEACDDTDTVQPPARQTSLESQENKGGEPAGIAATMQAVTAGRVGEAVDAKQAAED